MPEQPTIISRFDSYVGGLIEPDDSILKQVRANMEADGLPSIAVSSSEGAVLRELVRMTNAKRILEIGTLGGYSSIQMARGMVSDGTIVTLELSPLHADTAQKNIELAGFADTIQIKIGAAADTLRAMNAESGLEPFDIAFIDADKPGYPEYLDLAFPLVRPGGLILSDNTLRESILDDPADGMGAYNKKVVAHPGLKSFMIPVLRGDHIDGLLVSIKTG